MIFMSKIDACIGTYFLEIDFFHRKDMYHGTFLYFSLEDIVICK